MAPQCARSVEEAEERVSIFGDRWTGDHARLLRRAARGSPTPVFQRHDTGRNRRGHRSRRTGVIPEGQWRNLGGGIAPARSRCRIPAPRCRKNALVITGSITGSESDGPPASCSLGRVAPFVLDTKGFVHRNSLLPAHKDYKRLHEGIPKPISQESLRTHLLQDSAAFRRTELRQVREELTHPHLASGNHREGEDEVSWLECPVIIFLCQRSGKQDFFV